MKEEENLVNDIESLFRKEGWKPMNYYRRRSEDESPKNEQSDLILFRLKDSQNILMGWFEKFDEGDTFCCGEDGYARDEIEWWSYAYIPQEKKENGERRNERRK